MQQGWRLGVSTADTVVREQRRRRRAAAVRMAGGAALAVLLTACTGQGGTQAVAQNPRPVAGPDDHRATPAPDQRWGSAADQDHLRGGKRNTTVPTSLKARYPAVKAPAPRGNRAAVVPAAPEPVAGFDAATSREVPAGRGTHQRTWTNADGTTTTEYGATPLNYRAADGSLVPVDSTLKPAAGGGWERTADEVALRLAARADADELVRVTLPGGGSVAYSLAGARAVTGTAAADTARYPGVWDGVDVELQAQAGGVKDTLVLADADVPRSYDFPLTLTGLTAGLADGSVVLTDAAGVRRATIPAGYLIDAAGATSDGATYRLVTRDDGRPALRLTLDGRWLTDAGRVFPVRVDPPVVAEGAADGGSLVVDSNGGHGGGNELFVGGTGGATSYVKFSSLASGLRHHTIYGAQLSVVNFESPSCKPRAVSVHPVTSSWSSGSNSDPSTGGPLVTKSFAQGHVGHGQSASACPVTGTVFDLGTKGRDLVQGWADGKANNGIALKAAATAGTFKKFAGTTSANPPRLYVTHSPYNAKYAVPNPVPEPAVLQNQPGMVKITVTNRSAEDWRRGAYHLIYRAYDAGTGAAKGQTVAAALTTTIARGATATIEATIKPLAIGRYLLDFSMAKVGGPVFTDENVPPARISLQVDNILPVVHELYPPNGYASPTLTPQLWAQATDLDAPPKTTLQYRFELCHSDDAGKRTNCATTPDQAKQSWTVPVGKLSWSRAYQWRATVKDNAGETTSGWSTLLPAVQQPAITSRIANAPYGSQDREFDPNIGNYSTGGVDASVANVGPPLKVARTYNSLDPRRDLMFGAGWMTQFDMRVVPDDDGTGNLVVTYPDGQQVRFGKNPDGTYAAPSGRTAKLTVADGRYTLLDAAGQKYEFRGGDGKILRIVDKWGRVLAFTYDDVTAKLARVRSLADLGGTAGRSLTFGWTGEQVTSVSTDPVDGRRLTWTYTYTGALLTKVCAPGGVCTSYTYTDGSHYRSAVADSGPDGYWRLGDAAGSAAASSDLANNLGRDAGAAKDLAFGRPGALVGADNTAAEFNGTTSVLGLPRGIAKRSRDSAVELWFKISRTQTGGPLIGYQDTPFDGTPKAAVPLLYVGTDGRVRGQFKTTAAAPDPIESVADVRDDQWHHVALSVTADVQTLYLDGKRVGSKLAAAGVLDHSLLTFNQVGGAWATNPATWPRWGATAKRYFNGQIDEVAAYGHALGEEAVATHRALGVEKADQLASVILPSGKVASETTYDTSLDRVKEYTDGNGGTWKIGAPLVYGGDNDLRRAVEVLDPADRPHLYEYDALAGRLLRSGTPLGIKTRPEDQPPRPSPTPSPGPTEECTTPDPGEPRFCTHIPPTATGPVFTEHAMLGMAIRSFSYDHRGFQTEIKNEVGATVRMTHDDRGNVTSTTTCRRRGECQTSHTTYSTPAADPLSPRNDLPVETRDERSASATDGRYLTLKEYNNVGEVIVETGPDSGTTKTGYTDYSGVAVGSTNTPAPAGLVKSVTDVLGQVTRYGYNVYGDLVSVTSPTGLKTEYTYDALGRRIAEKEISDAFPAGVVTTHTYDDLGRLVTTTGPVTTDVVDKVRHQMVRTSTYDVDGNVTTTTESDALTNDPPRVTTMEYDEFNRLVRTVNPEGDEQTEGWDRFGNRVLVVDGNNNRYEYAYTARNALAEVRLYDWKGDPEDAPRTDDYVVLAAYVYDHAGRMAAQIDSMGRRTEYSYYDDDLLDKVVLKGFRNPDGSKRDYVVEANTYDKAGNLTKKVTRNGTLTTTHTIDDLGRVSTATVDPGGVNRTTTYTYDLMGNVRRTVQGGNASNVPWPVENGATTTVENVYDAFGRVKQEKAIAGGETRTTSYTYDQRGLATSSTDPRGNVAGGDPAAYTTNYTYDELGQQVAVVAPTVDVESGGSAPRAARPEALTGYNAWGERVATKDALGNVARASYDRMGRVAGTTGPLYAPSGGGPVVPSAPLTKTRYDALGNPTEVTDPRGNVTRYTYDRLNRLTVRDEPAATNDERAVSRYTYTRTGKVLSSTSPTGIRSEMTYDDLDRPVTSTRFERKPRTDTFTTRRAYDDGGNLVEVVAPSGAKTVMTYNAVGDLLTTTDPNNVVTRQGYDGFGAPVRITDGAGRTIRRSYDGFGQLSAESDLNASLQGLRTEKFAYDPAGNIVKRTNALGKDVTFAYNALNKLTRQVEPKGDGTFITTTFGYDASGNRTRYTDGRGNSTVYGVNSLGLPETVIEPSTAAHRAPGDRTWTVAYDLNGNARQLTAPGGAVRVRDYDAADRLRTETGTVNGSTVNRGLAYDLEGRVTGVDAPGGSNTFAYNDRGLLLSATGPSGNASYAYNADGQVTGRTDAAGAATFGYAKGRLTTMKDGATAVTQTLGYDTAGMLKSIDYGAGRVRTYGYDDFGRVASDVLKNSDGTEIAKVGYTYDLDDHLTGKETAGTAGAGKNTYGYDDAGRLTSWTSPTGTVHYAWDDSGNRIRAGAKTATYDERNRLLTDGDHTYSYTARGTLATRTATGSGTVEEYSFDAFDRLVAAEGQTYSYDGLNRVLFRGGTAFSYAGLEQDPVTDGAETFARGPNGELLAVAEGVEKRLALADEHGDVVASFGADEALTALRGSTAFDPYGQRIASAGAQNNVGFQGDWTDPVTGQVNMGARWYEPGTGAFTSRDSVTYSSGDSILANRYTYGAGDPMSNTDPDGHWPSCGWCKRAMNAVVNVVKTVAAPVIRAVSSAGSWLYNQARAAYSVVKNTVRSAWNGAKNLYNKYVAPVIKRGTDFVQQRVREAAAAARAVTQRAKAAISYVAKNTPIGRIAKAALPVIAGLGKLVVTAVTQPAKIVSSFNAVVQDVNKAANQLYKEAAAMGGALVEGAKAVGDWVAEHKADIAGFVAGAVVGVGCGVAIGWTGVGAIGCAALAGAVGSVVTDLVEGGKGWKEMAANALMGATIGAVLGPLMTVGGSAVSSGVRALAGGAGREALAMGASAAMTTMRGMGGHQVGGLLQNAIGRRAASAGVSEAAESAGAPAVARATASEEVKALVKGGKLRQAADFHYEDMVRARTGGTSQMINGREIDSVTEDALIQVKRSLAAVERPKNFLSKSTRTQIKETISSAEETGRTAEFWFKYGAHRTVRDYIEGKGGIVRLGLGED